MSDKDRTDTVALIAIAPQMQLYACYVFRHLYVLLIN